MVGQYREAEAQGGKKKNMRLLEDLQFGGMVQSKLLS